VVPQEMGASTVAPATRATLPDIVFT
jgi:hypothetical protein